MCEARSKAAQQVEKKIPHRTQPVLHVVAEDVKRPHVSQEMPETPMNEHERKQRKCLFKQSKVGSNCRHRVAGRNQAVGDNKFLQHVTLS